MLRQSNYIPIFRDNIVYPDNQNNEKITNIISTLYQILCDYLMERSNMHIDQNSKIIYSNIIDNEGFNHGDLTIIINNNKKSQNEIIYLTRNYRNSIHIERYFFFNKKKFIENITNLLNIIIENKQFFIKNNNQSYEYQLQKNIQYHNYYLQQINNQNQTSHLFYQQQNKQIQVYKEQKQVYEEQEQVYEEDNNNENEKDNNEEEDNNNEEDNSIKTKKNVELEFIIPSSHIKKQRKKDKKNEENINNINRRNQRNRRNNKFKKVNIN